jgi:hypothetical protein
LVEGRLRLFSEIEIRLASGIGRCRGFGGRRLDEICNLDISEGFAAS